MSISYVLRQGCLAGKARSYGIHDAWGQLVGARLAREDAD